jgi:NAD(P)-dependent dehydrogenase (short-subunit alcohol dehydrogenase family)
MARSDSSREAVIMGTGTGRLNGKAAVITGAASGIGRASALRFAAEGAAVVVADLNIEGGEEVARQCREDGGRAVFQKTDVSSEADIKAAIGRALAEFGRLDVMFSNAGIAGATGPIEETTVEDWDRTQAALLRSVFLAMKHAIPVMRKAGGGSIISTASVAGLRGGAGPHAYSAAKAGVISLTRSVAIEAAKDRIRVNCICPGGINTPIFSLVPGGSEAVEQVLSQAQPIRRAGKPDDIAAMALFLASDESEWITGTAMVVDGGLMTGGSMFNLQAMDSTKLPPAFFGPSFEFNRPRD